MKFISILLFFCGCSIHGWGQPSLSDDKITGHYTNGNKQYEGYKRHEKWNGEWTSWYINGQLLDSGIMRKGIPDGTWVTHYENGPTQFIRTFSSDKWLLFQNEKERYHPKRISMPVTKLFHENRKQAKKYIKPINTFCAKKNCVRAKEDFLQIINNNTEQEHYHPVFENGWIIGGNLDQMDG